MFTEFFSPLKKDGSVNEFGMKYLKLAMQPYADHLGGRNFGEVIKNINKISICAILTRTVDKKDSDRFNFRLRDVVVL